MLTKKLIFTNDILDVIKAMSWSDDDKIGKLNRNLDRKLYTNVNTALEAMDGKWNKKDKGHIFSEDPRPQVTELLSTESLTITRNGFFCTPRNIVKSMIDAIGIPEGTNILEPSAEDGSRTDVLVEYGAEKGNIYYIEKNEQRAKTLGEKGYEVVCDDFLNIPIEYYDRIFMNSPFEEGQDIDEHIQFAMTISTKAVKWPLSYQMVPF